MRRLDAFNHPDREDDESGFIERGPHKIKWAVSGNPNGIPVILSHGGPGGQNKAFYRTLFDLEKWRMIQIDQAGNGVSEPAGEIRENTTQLSISDMETLREQLGIERWVVAGGSWGSTLSIAYAQAYPERVRALFLFCMWLGAVKSLEFWFDAGQHIFPECYADMVAGLSETEQRRVLDTICRRILGDDPDLARDAAYRLHDYEQVLMSLHPPLTTERSYDPTVFSRIMAHYFVNDCFLEPGQLERDAHRLADIPIKILQGRFDMCTPPSIAFQFKTVVPHADLRIVENASHMPTEHNFLREIVRAGGELYEALTDVPALDDR